MPSPNLPFRTNSETAPNIRCVLTHCMTASERADGGPLAFLYVVVPSGRHWITLPSGHQLFLWPQQTWWGCHFFPTQQAPLAPLWLLGRNPRSQGGVGPKLITVSIDFPFPIPPLSLCWGALSWRRRLCSGRQKRWNFRKIERTKKCDKLP